MKKSLIKHLIKKLNIMSMNSFYKQITIKNLKIHIIILKSKIKKIH